VRTVFQAGGANPTRSVLAGLCLGAALASPAGAQLPSADWQTLTTVHFRLAYPAPAEAWTRQLASRLEAYRAAVVARVGYAGGEMIDVLVMDPEASANGSALPLLGRPRMVVWTTPPLPGSQLANFDDWSGLLALHETTHLVHLLRPSRNPLDRLLAKVVPFGPLALRTPRWATEGYATYLEGQLTGRGRPASDLRAAILRRFAAAGRLPSYGALSSAAPEPWLGSSMAYLGGSAFLEWLVRDDADDQRLVDLWRRLSARQRRSFDDAFTGVFGDPPGKLWNRFVAETTWQAIEAEHRRADAKRGEQGGSQRDGTLWLDLRGSVSPPAVSADGKLIALVERNPKRPSRLAVWSTDDDPEAARKAAEKRAELVARDPGDVPAAPREPGPREPRYVLASRHGAEPFAPRFLADGSLLFLRAEPDGLGMRHGDLYRWQPGRAAAARLTHGADLFDFDPLPDARAAVAVRIRWGAAQLVRVELATAAVTELSAPAVTTVLGCPRVSPDGEHVAYLRQRSTASDPSAADDDAGRWQIVVRDLAGGGERVVPTPVAWSVQALAWGDGGRSLVISAGEQGRIDLYRLDLDRLDLDGTAERLTRATGAGLSPAPLADGSAIFYLDFDADGYDLHRLALPERAALPSEPSSANASDATRPGIGPPVEPPVIGAPPPWASGPTAAGEPYGHGRLEPRVLLGGRVGPGPGWTAGLRLGDVVGRLDGLLLAGDGDRRGALLAAAWRGGFAPGWPVTLVGEAWTAREQPAGRDVGQERRGVALTATWSTDRRVASAAVELAGVVGEQRAADDGWQDLGLTTAAARGDLALRWNRLRLTPSAEAKVAWGTTGNDGWRRLRGALGVELGWDERAVAVDWSRGEVSGAVDRRDSFLLGGEPSSLEPAALDGNRVWEPALPSGVAAGPRFERQRVALRLGQGFGGPLELFATRTALWGENEPRTWQRVLGLTLHVDLAPLPVAALPAVRLDLGLARRLDPPFAGSNTAWLAVIWRP
jgi:hypothetical protein